MPFASLSLLSLCATLLAAEAPPARPASPPAPTAPTRPDAPSAPTPPTIPASAGPTIPPDAEHASKALVDSPRHGEWVDVMVMPAEGAPSQVVAEKIRTWVVFPERKDPAPVVVVIHEIFGLTDWVRAVADQLAAEGFIAVAPDLLSGMAPGGGGTEGFKGDEARAAIAKLTPEMVARKLDAVRDRALKMPSAKPASACIGFCWGGSSSFSYATVQRDLKGAVVFYGTAPTDRAALARIACPVLGLYGADDARVTSTVEATSAAMKELDRPFTAHIYPGAGHGFLRQQTGRDGANLKAAQESWKETVGFLRKVTE